MSDIILVIITIVINVVIVGLVLTSNHAYQDGARAKLDGDNVTDNPYSVYSDDWYEWRRGYRSSWYVKNSKG